MLSYGDKGIPKKLWVNKPLWMKIERLVPISCVDMIFQRKDGSILYGFRIIEPYKNVWALVGGRMLYRENLKQAATRIAHEYGLELNAENVYLNGVFPISFPNRSDVVVSLATFDPCGKPVVDGKEFTKLVWMKTPPKGLALNYCRMVAKWRTASQSKDFLKLNRL